VQKEVDITRVRLLNSKAERKGPVIYWMSRDQRVNDNWALLYAQQKALEKEEPLIVLFCLVPRFLDATLRHYSFMLEGLREVEGRLQELNIGFVLISGQPEAEITGFMNQVKAGVLVTDFSPLRVARGWKQRVSQTIDVAGFEVDAHNIVPCWEASEKQEYAAYTIRPKINRLLPEYLVDIPLPVKHPFKTFKFDQPTDWSAANRSLKADSNFASVENFTPGEAAAKEAMADFIEDRLPYYSNLRNDPTADGQSGLSPYLHFGQLSAQRLAYEVKKEAGKTPAGADFLEELIVRRELSDNFCYYNDQYDLTEAFPNWAKATLKVHLGDRREYLYSLEQFEKAQTHDDLWNAAQNEMVIRGKMHGYLRMYWAKKILEWSSSPEEALKTAIYLNDRYSLDGRDPNGYAGIAWSIGGVHDRAWPERPIFGKIRFMSYKGSKSKFNIQKYIEKVNNL
jgi:deoxyribodipyrimidine photo-lyase